MSHVTTTNAGVLSYAFDYFNQTLFGGILPDVMIVLHRKAGAYGYHHEDQFSAKVEGLDRPFVSEIALNPQDLARPDRDVMSTLVHEMVHEWQARYGETRANGTHNKEWAAKMEEVGLIPSHTGEPGGKRTGKKVSHYIELGGAFDVACTELLKYVRFEWTALPDLPKAKRETVKRVKMACPCCPDVEVRAVPGTRVRCGNCDELLEEAVA